MWTLIIGAIIGSLGAGLAKSEKKGCLFNIFAGIVGSYVGQALLGDWGPDLAGMAIFPSIIGAALVTMVVAYMTGERK